VHRSGDRRMIGERILFTFLDMADEL